MLPKGIGSPVEGLYGVIAEFSDPQALLDGANAARDKGYSEFNVDLGYKVNEHLKLQATAFNLTNVKANAGAFYYAARLKGEPVDGVNDYQNHPIEPLSGNIKVTWTF